MNLTKINIREKEFHNKLHTSGNPRPENKYYKALNNLYEDFLILLKYKNFYKFIYRGIIFLNYGCYAKH